jgi:hypothetical protein
MGKNRVMILLVILHIFKMLHSIKMIIYQEGLISILLIGSVLNVMMVMGCLMILRRVCHVRWSVLRGNVIWRRSIRVSLPRMIVSVGSMIILMIKLEHVLKVVTLLPSIHKSRKENCIVYLLLSLRLRILLRSTHPYIRIKMEPIRHFSHSVNLYK